MDSLKKTIYAELFSEEMTKGDKTRANILEACIEVVTRRGYSDTRFQDIAAECGHTRTLVNHYFPTKKELFITLAKYIRLNYQSYVLSKINELEDESKTLETYIDSALNWVIDFPKESKVWLLIFHLSTFDEEFKGLNTELVKMGHQRICSLLEQSQITRILSLQEHAKMIQIIITGCIICIQSEELSHEMRISYIEQSKRSCLDLF